MQELHGLNLPLNLTPHVIVPHDLILVDDLDGDRVAVGGVYRELDLGEVAFPDRPAEPVLPHVIPVPHVRTLRPPSQVNALNFSSAP